MYNISEDEIDFILNDITKRGIVTKDVRDNILDHVCCIIELEMTADMSFNKLYTDTIAQFYHNNLSEIEAETQDLLTFKYFFAMKRTLKITGGISGILILLGSILKVFHLPYAGLLLVIGLTFFSLVFLPLNAVLKYRDDTGKNRIIMALGMLITAAASIGILFKIMHWPAANILIQTSIAAFVLFYIPIYFATRLKKAETKFNGTINTIFMLAVCGMLFALTNGKSNNNLSEGLANLDIALANSVALEKENNLLLFQNMVNSTDENRIKTHEKTEIIFALIDRIKTNVISKAEGISKAEATQFNGKFHNPQAQHVIREYFSNNSAEDSYTDLQNQITAYNNHVKLINADIKLIDLESFNLEQQVMALFVHDLTQIQLQILRIENKLIKN